MHTAIGHPVARDLVLGNQGFEEMECLQFESRNPGVLGVDERLAVAAILDGQHPLATCGGGSFDELRT